MTVFLCSAASGNRKAVDISVETPDVEPSYAEMPRLKKTESSVSDEGAASFYMPGQDGEKKKKKGFLSFLHKKKEGKFRLVSPDSSPYLLGSYSKY